MRSYSHSIFLQALCILANVADGHTAKSFVMENDDILKKIMNYMVRCLTLSCG